MLMWLVWFLCFGPAVAAGSFDLNDDTTSALGPADWFYAKAHIHEINRFVREWQGPCDLHAVDVFGASRSISKAFTRRFYRAQAWDIHFDPRFDIVSKSGWYNLLQLCLRLFPYGLLAAGPPCSLFVWLCCSVHKRFRCGFDARGNEQNLKVKLGNYITENLAICIMALLEVRPFIQVMVEQPRSSVMFELDVWQRLGAAYAFQSVSTYMGCFGHFMEKPSTLYGNMEKLCWLERNMGKKKMEAMRKQVAANRAKFEQKLGRPLNIIKKSGKSVTGGSDLAYSAAYTSKFSAALFQAWFRTWAVLQSSVSSPAV